MSDIVLLDTSVYLNILDIPDFNQDRDRILEEFAIRVDGADHFLLPLVSIIETGNHIADLNDGGNRYRYAQKLVDDVTRALSGDAPYRPTEFPDREQFLSWLPEFPGFAQRNKHERKTREGVSLVDLAIIKEWERACARHAMSTVLIWSLDSDLKNHRRPGRGE